MNEDSNDDNVNDAASRYRIPYNSPHTPLRGSILTTRENTGSAVGNILDLPCIIWNKKP